MDSSHVSHIEAANSRLIVDGDLDSIAEFFASDYIAHLTDRQLVGHTAIHGFLRMLRGAFLNLEVEVEVLLEDAERVAWYRTVRGTHTGEYAGFPPTGRVVVWRDMATSRFHDGLIAEEWAVSELAEQLLRTK